MVRRTNPALAMTHTPLQQPFCTTREAARMLGVSLRTAQLWAESGLLTAWKTSGGHRRITLESVDRLLTGRRGAETPEAAVPPVFAGAAAPLILVAEDDPIFQELYATMLPRWSMAPRVSLANNGFDALVRVGLARPDVLITNLDMPGMDGFEMLRSIQSMPELADLRLIVATGLSDQEIARRHGVPAGIPVFRKPIDFAALERQVAALLDRS